MLNLLKKAQNQPRSPFDWCQNWGLAIFSALALLAYGSLARMQWVHGSLRNAQTPETIRWYLLAFVAFVGGVIWVEKRAVSMKWVWVSAVLFRLALLFTPPTLSDDVYRYLWDGYVANEGVSPYAYAIDAPELDYLDIPQRAQANNSWMASPYLPAAQAVFWGVTAVLPLKPIIMQVAMVIFDLLAAWMLAKLLRFVSLPPHRLILYLWNPLVVVEVAHGAHIDAWMVLLTLLAVYFTNENPQITSIPQIFYPRSSAFIRVQFLEKRPFPSLLAPLFLALATLTKVLPILLLPVLFWQWSWRQRISYAVFTVGLLLPFGLSAGWGLSGDLDGTGVFGALRIYSAQWNFNSGLFHWLEKGLGAPGFGSPTLTAKLIILAILMGVLVGVWLAARQRPSPLSTLRLITLPLSAYILLTPTVHPWYLLILLAFVPFLPPEDGESRWVWLTAVPWLYLSGAIIFSYLTYLDPHHFAELEWVRLLEWLPTLILVGVVLLNEVRPFAAPGFAHTKNG